METSAKTAANVDELFVDIAGKLPKAEPAAAAPQQAGIALDAQPVAGAPRSACCG